MKHGDLQDRNEIFILTVPDLSALTYCQTCGTDGRREDMVRLFQSAIVCQSCAAEIRRQSQIERRAAMTAYPVKKRAPEPSRAAFERHFSKVGKDLVWQRAEWIAVALLVLVGLYGLGSYIHDAVRHGAANNPFRNVYEQLERVTR